MPEQFGTHDPTKRYKLEKFEDEYIPHLQVIFLAQVEKVSIETIAKITNYAIATVKTYCYKFAKAIDKAKRYFCKMDIVIKEKRRKREIVSSHNEPKIPDSFCAYVVECYDKAFNLVWLKVGKTKNWPQRIKGLYREYRDDDINFIKPRFFFPVSEEDDALTMENTLRKFYKNNPASTFIKNDRFRGISFDKDELLASSLIKQQYQLLGYSL